MVPEFTPRSSVARGTPTPVRDPTPLHPATDLREDLTFAIDSYNWYTLGTWEFVSRHRAGYLSDVDFFNWERGVRLDDDEEDEDDKVVVFDAMEEEEELQPRKLTDVEAMKMSNLVDLSQWEGLSV
jgi:hypothetical protein